jgi:hypothetical protein
MQYLKQKSSFLIKKRIKIKEIWSIKMSKRGRHAWLPSVVVGEIEDLQKDEGIPVFAEACQEFAKYARIGREVDRMMKFNFKDMLPFKKKGKRGFP